VGSTRVPLLWSPTVFYRSKRLPPLCGPTRCYTDDPLFEAVFHFGLFGFDSPNECPNEIVFVRIDCLCCCKVKPMFTGPSQPFGFPIQGSYLYKTIWEYI